MPGRSLEPFADEIEPPAGRLYRKAPKPKHGTHAYGLDAVGRVVIARRYFTATAYVETHYLREPTGTEWVTYQHDATLLGAGRASMDAGKLVRVLARGWMGQWTDTRVEYRGEHIALVQHCHPLSKGEGTWRLEPRWAPDGMLDAIVKRHGTRGTAQVVYRRPAAGVGDHGDGGRESESGEKRTWVGSGWVGSGSPRSRSSNFTASAGQIRLDVGALRWRSGLLCSLAARRLTLHIVRGGW